MMELINDHFQNYKRYQIPKAQLVIAEVAIGKTARAKKLIRPFSIRTEIFASWNSSTSVTASSSQNLKAR